MRKTGSEGWDVSFYGTTMRLKCEEYEAQDAEPHVLGKRSIFDTSFRCQKTGKIDEVCWPI
jgi:hypothetical protein